MSEVHQDFVWNSENESPENTSQQNGHAPRPAKRPRTASKRSTDQHDESDSSLADEVTTKRQRVSKAKKGKERQHSRSRSPLHHHTEEEALELFGPSMTMFSLFGPPGGYQLSHGILRCNPEDEGRASFNFNYPDEARQWVEEEMDKVRQEAIASTSTPVPKRTSKQNRKPKMKGSPKPKDMNGSLDTLDDGNADTGLSPNAAASSSTRKASRKAAAVIRAATRQRNDSDDDSDDDDGGTSTLQASSRKPRKKPAPNHWRRSQPDEFMLDSAPEGSRKVCHQCRSRNRFAKMHCNFVKENGELCTLSYCHKCISRRPEIEFTPDGSFKCFRCSETCSCLICRFV
ncbi:uncharacterized protein FOMMEDRAFT_133843 [Fomitiporia mediterranea MF3/22]|uniref:uncharacterized protein n=1 Tax=Fomitiporia mediterranea (strain MF3/22) TaxID=694068 RepID=UPI0004409753|nr:uncharacterized protein FOMMEDRAFT_133843 [Fomitiporia mediterranea MF3/22]EJD04644.1 hypothetical protein FOMMEDRAFT_133843 [Fomitiporia mediterranea MF3/22]